VVSRVFASRLTQARTARGWTKAELLRRVGRGGRSNATGWEQGVVPDPDTLRALAVALDVSLDWLFGLDREAAGVIDLAAVGTDEPPVSWSGRPLSPAERRRAFLVLHGLLADAAQLGRLPAGWQDGLPTDENPIRDRATVVASVPHTRPKTNGRRRRRGRGDVVGKGDGGG